MGLWSAYFFAKLMLYAEGYIDFSPWLNLAFAVFTALPPKNARQRFAKNLLAVPLGILLLYYDSWLPPITRALSQTQTLRSFTLPYLWELLGRFISWKVVAELAAMLIVYGLARRKLRLSTFVFIAIVLVMVVPHGWPLQPANVVQVAAADAGTSAPRQIDARNLRPEALDAMLAQFYAKEQMRQVRFTRAAQNEIPYDILLLHVCSLSWDDLRAVKRERDPLFSRFDIVLSDFGSAASYSGPAAIRLLRGNCGQTAHKRLYDTAERECLTIDGLQNAGFEPHWLMNHDGHFGNFLSDVREHGGVAVAPEDNRGAQEAQQSYDGTPIYSDYSTLSRWWAKREMNRAARVALYYNTISLHDGNRVVATAHADSSYDARIAQFSTDIGRFLDDLQRSGRRVIVVLIAEHGAALRGDRRQIPGLREIPTPAIAHVPVGIVLVNATRSAQSAQERIDVPTSYIAVNELLSRFIADNPFAKPSLSLASYTQGLPPTDFVAENDGTTVVQIGRRYMMRSPDGAWASLDASSGQ
jgi:cellulose synthase operon protein YhjU